MAKQKPKAPATENIVARPNPPSSSEALGSGQGVNLSAMAVSPHLGYAEAINAKAVLVKQDAERLNVQQLEALMGNVKEAQRNLTVGMKSLAEYRSAVASLLETKRRKAAAERKSSKASTTKAVVLLETTPDVNPTIVGPTSE